MSAKLVRNTDTLPTRLLALEESAFSHLADHFGPLFRAMFIRRGLTPLEADDLAASCITNTAMQIKAYRPIAGKPFDAWAFTIARNAVADWWRQTTRRKSSIVQLQLSNPPLSQELRPRACVVAAVQEALSALPAPYREIIFLRDLGEQKSYEEVAGELRITAGAARVRHKRAVEKLRSMLERDRRIKGLIDRWPMEPAACKVAV